MGKICWGLIILNCTIKTRMIMLMILNCIIKTRMITRMDGAGGQVIDGGQSIDL